jgi:acyl-CoA dehydrogenase
VWRACPARPFKQHFKRPRDIPLRGMARREKCALALWPRCDYSCRHTRLSDPGGTMTKHAYIPRTTNYTLNPGDELNDLRMSDQVRPLYDHVRKFIRDTVEPMSIEFAKAGESKKDRWSFTPEAARGARGRQEQGQEGRPLELLPAR